MDSFQGEILALRAIEATPTRNDEHIRKLASATDAILHLSTTLEKRLGHTTIGERYSQTFKAAKDLLRVFPTVSSYESAIRAVEPVVNLVLQSTTASSLHDIGKFSPQLWSHLQTRWVDPSEPVTSEDSSYLCEMWTKIVGQIIRLLISLPMIELPGINLKVLVRKVNHSLKKRMTAHSQGYLVLIVDPVGYARFTYNLSM
jgi:hypothetical protein